MRNKGLFLLVVFSLIMSGCAVVLQKGRPSDIEKIKSLEDELAQLRGTKEVLEDQLSSEIADKQVKLEMAEKGLVITFVAEVLFDSGKAKLRRESFPTLDKVASILIAEVPDNSIGIEGHTDNVAIKYSGWKSNWELSSQRALSVLYYLEDQGVDPARLSAIGYGEYQPVVSNETTEGRQTNRRVEIVILPKSVKKADEEVVVIEEMEELK